MRLVPATLVRRYTLDGLGEVSGLVPLYSRYLVDLDSVRTAAFWNVEWQRHHVKDIIDVDGGGWFFIELLSLRADG